MARTTVPVGRRRHGALASSRGVRSESRVGKGVVFALVFLTACSPSVVAPIRDASFVPSSDERELWEQAAALEEAFTRVGVLYEDNELTRYLEGVGARLIAASSARGVSIRVHVLQDPYLNAFALPNGSIYFHTGLLARLENEAQLATVFAHELEHFLQRHTLREQRSAHNRAVAAQVLVGLVAVAVVAGTQGVPSAAAGLVDAADGMANRVVSAQVEGYSRDLERAADARGLDTTIAASYDPREAPRVFEHLLAEERAAESTEPYYLGSHPALTERLESYRSFLASRPAGASSGAWIVGRSEYDRAVGGAMLANAELEMRLHRWERARAIIDRHLGSAPSSARGHHVLGEWYRRGGADVDRDGAAVLAYRRALELDPNLADAHRELGLMLRAQYRGAEARVHLARYVALRPEAPDRAIIEAYAESAPPRKGAAR